MTGPNFSAACAHNLVCTPPAQKLTDTDGVSFAEYMNAYGPLKLRCAYRHSRRSIGQDRSPA